VRPLSFYVLLSEDWGGWGEGGRGGLGAEPPRKIFLILRMFFPFGKGNFSEEKTESEFVFEYLIEGKPGIASPRSTYG
jgi:hypothetical protein